MIAMPERKRKHRADFIASVSAMPSRVWIVAFMLGAVALAGALVLAIG
jgi:hypothetical protein